MTRLRPPSGTSTSGASSAPAVGTDLWFGYSDTLSAPGTFTFSSPTTDGPSFCTLSEDGQTVTIDENCVIQLTLELQYVPDAGAEGACNAYFEGSILSSPYFAADNEQITTRIAASTTANMPSAPIWTTPPVKANAGATIQVSHAVNFGNGGAITAAVFLGIVKVAALPNP